MASIFSLFGNVFIDNEKANKSIDETTKKGKESSKSFTESFVNVSKKAVEIGTAVVGATTAIVGGLTAAASSTAGVADEVDKGSIRMGISNKYYQELGYAAGQCGVEMSALEKAAKKLEGTDLNMEGAMQQIMSLGTAEERAAKASELFGKSVAYTLSPLIEQSTEDYDGLIQRASDLGLVMGDDSVSAGVKFGDTLADVKNALGAAGNQVMSAVIPTLQKLLDLVIEHMPEIQEMIGRLAPIITDLLDEILPIIVDFAEQLFPILFDLLEQIFPILSELIKAILPIFMDALKMILPPLIQIIQDLLPFITEIIRELLPMFTDILNMILPPLIEIIQELLPIFVPIIQALIPILRPLLDMILWSIDTILKPIISVITSIAGVISGTLVAALKGLAPVLEFVRDVFQTVFGGLFEIVKFPINLIIDGINKFIEALNKLKIPDWVPFVGGKGINLPFIKRLRVGLDYVPYDEMQAVLHKGERVLTAEENREYTQNANKKTEPVNVIYNNNITIENMEVRDDTDINQIAEELYYLQKREVGV